METARLHLPYDQYLFQMSMPTVRPVEVSYMTP